MFLIGLHSIFGPFLRKHSHYKNTIVMKGVLLKSYMLAVVDCLKEEGRYGTAHVHQSVLNSILEYAGTSFPLSGLTPAFLKGYEEYLVQTKGREWNTSSTYMRCLQAVYHRALDEWLVPFIPQQFRNVYTGTRRNHRRALSKSTMRKLLSGEPQISSSSCSSVGKRMSPLTVKARICFELMLRFRGMCFIDLAFLRKTDLRNGYLVLQRHKTGSPLRIRISSEALRLIRRCADSDPDSPYLLGILDGRLTGYPAYCDYQSKLRQLNIHLKQLAAERRIYTPVSSYCARHTWATQAKYCGISTSVISEGLGHASVTTTEAYLKAFDDSVIDEANDVVMDFLFKDVRKAGNKRSALFS